MIFQASHYFIGLFAMVLGLLTSHIMSINHCILILELTAHEKVLGEHLFLRFIVPKADAFICYLLEGDYQLNQLIGVVFNVDFLNILSQS